MEEITGLHVAKTSHLNRENPCGIYEAENWQVGVYGPSGVYTPHVDAFARFRNSEGEIIAGNRMATAMFYVTKSF